MKKLLALFMGLGLLSQQALAMTVMGDNFDGYVDTVISKTSGVWMDTGTETDQTKAPEVSYNLADVTASITDDDAGTWIGGFYSTDSIDLAFNAGVVNRDGLDDLKIFFVGGAGQTVGVTIGGQTVNYTLPANLTPIGNLAPSELDSVYGEYPIVAIGIELGDFGVLPGPVTEISMAVGDRWCGTDGAQGGNCSSLPSFVGGYSVVPVPAAVWLFGSGLLGLVGVARRKK